MSKIKQNLEAGDGVHLTKCMLPQLLQLCPTLCNPINHSLPGSSVHGILQARILEWVAMPFSPAGVCAQSLQLCPTLCNPMDCSAPGSSVHGILQARILEWVASSREEGIQLITVRASLGAQMVKDPPTMQETWARSLGREDPLEEGMATLHSSILAWRIPWTEEPGGLQSMGSQRVGHD